jgi:hypothetical protein
MMVLILVILGCLGLLIVAGLIAGLLYIAHSSRPDAVSAAREEWISQHRERDDGQP